LLNVYLYVLIHLIVLKLFYIYLRYESLILVDNLLWHPATWLLFHNEDLLNKSRLPTLKIRRFRTMAIEVYKIMNKKKSNVFKWFIWATELSKSIQIIANYRQTCKAKQYINKSHTYILATKSSKNKTLMLYVYALCTPLKPNCTELFNHNLAYVCLVKIVVCFCFVCLRFVYPMFPVSLDIQFWLSFGIL
jgi:hypothetical protein